MSTLKDIAKYTGFSISTVSYALNGKGSISDKTAKIIIETAKKLKYNPNGTIARRLKTGISNLLGVIVNLDNLVNYSNKILNILNSLCSKNGYRLIVVHSEDFAQDISFMKENKVDGIFYLATNYIDSSIFLSFKKLDCQIPIVFINCWHKDYSSSCIRYDEEEAIFDVTSLLIKNKHQHIGCITGEKNWSATRLRLNGFKKACRINKLEHNIQNIFYGSYYISNQIYVEDHVRELLSRRISAIVCFNDIIAATVYKIANQMSIDIPHDLSVTGFDNQLFGSFIFPSLTSIDIPVQKLSESAFSCLLSKIHHDSSSMDSLIPCEIIERESSSFNRA